MTLNAKTLWAALTLAGLIVATAFANGCASGLSGSAPVDANIERADTNGVNHRIVADHLNEGILLVFPHAGNGIDSNLWWQLSQAGFYIWQWDKGYMRLDKVTDSDAERAAIAAASKLGAYLAPIPDTTQ